MKKPAISPSQPNTSAAPVEVCLTETATVAAAQRSARAGAHFDFHEASAISISLRLRSLKRFETRAPFPLP